MSRHPTFREVEFMPTPHTSAAQKAKFANRLADFIESGMDRRKFSKALYNDLCGSFGFLAHYDAGGFAAEYFADPRRKANFITELLNHQPFGSPGHTNCDVEAVITRWLRYSDVPARVFAEADRYRAALNAR